MRLNFLNFYTKLFKLLSQTRGACERYLLFGVYKLTITSLLAICLIASAISSSAFAAGAIGNSKTVKVNGYVYSYYSSIYKNDTSIWAYTEIESPNKVNFPAGYFGALARLYNDDYELVKSKGWWYNNEELGGTMYCTDSCYTAGTYYSKGQVKFYNGNGYTTYTCYSSPNLQLTKTSVPESYEVNTRGLTYGTDYYSESPETTPDLIRAVGINGTKGYVYSKDLDYQPNTLEEVLSYIEEEHTNYTIPVYAEDGITVIDQFEISFDIPSTSVY